MKPRLPPSLIAMRKQACFVCPDQCLAYRSETLDFATPSTPCAANQWPAYLSTWGRLSPAAVLPALEERVARARAQWAEIHTDALAGRIDDAYLAALRGKLKRLHCECLDHFSRLLADLPFRADDQFAWSVDIHNHTNARLGGDRRQWTIEEALQRWCTDSARPPESVGENEG